MGILIFISHSTKDFNSFRIEEMGEKLKSYPEIDDVLYWEKDMKGDIIKYMNNNLSRCDLLILICSKNALISNPVETEWQTAFKLEKSIIPLFKKEENIPTLLTTKLGIKYSGRFFLKTIEDLYNLILKTSGIEKLDDQNYLTYVKEQLVSKAKKKTSTPSVIYNLKGKDIRAKIIVQIIKNVIIKEIKLNHLRITVDKLRMLNKMIQLLNIEYKFTIGEMNSQELKNQQFDSLIIYLFGYGLNELKNRIENPLYKFLIPALSKKVFAGDLAFLLSKKQEIIEKFNGNLKVKLDLVDKLDAVFQEFEIQGFKPPKFYNKEFDNAFELLYIEGFIVYEDTNSDVFFTTSKILMDIIDFKGPTNSSDLKDIIDVYVEKQTKWTFIHSEETQKFIENYSLIYFLEKFNLMKI